MKLRQSEWPVVCFRYPAQTRNNTERFFLDMQRFLLAVKLIVLKGLDGKQDIVY